MDKYFRIQNMDFQYPTDGTSLEPTVVINWTASFGPSYNVAGRTPLTMTEFMGVTTGMPGYAEVVARKIAEGFESLEEIEED